MSGEKVKKKLTLSVDESIIDLAKIENLNISNVLEDYLRNYLETNSTEAIDSKISKLNDHIKILNERKAQLIILGASETKTQGLQVKVLQELKDYYKLRQGQGLTNASSDLEWLSSPKNVQRCKIIGKQPIEIAMLLRDEFNNQKI